MQMAKQPNNVRGNQIGCINFQQCPICYGCRAYDERFEECRECYELGKDGSNRNFNICNNLIIITIFNIIIIFTIFNIYNNVTICIIFNTPFKSLV